MLRNLNNNSRDANRVGSVSETASIRPPASMLGYDPTCQGRTPLGRFNGSMARQTALDRTRASATEASSASANAAGATA